MNTWLCFSGGARHRAAWPRRAAGLLLGLVPGLVAGGLLSVGLGAPAWAAPPTAPSATTAPPAKATTDTHLSCEVSYLPTRSTWVRTVTLTHAGKRLRSVSIDGVAVYTFALSGPVVLTSLDNERIQLDLSQPAWTSDFRGLATGQGLCVLQP